MFIAKNNDLIILANESRQALEQQLQFMVYTSIEETEENYILYNGSYLKVEEALPLAKIAKYEENDKKAEEARYSKEFYVTIQEQECLFDTKAQTQADLLTAFSVCSTGATYDGWITNNNITIDLTLEDVVVISTKFKELSNVYPHWSYYQTLIDNAQTLTEVEAIVIDYNINLGE